MTDAITLTGARIYVHPLEPPIPVGSIVIRNGRVDAVGAGEALSQPSKWSGD